MQVNADTGDTYHLFSYVVLWRIKKKEKNKDPQA